MTSVRELVWIMWVTLVQVLTSQYSVICYILGTWPYFANTLPKAIKFYGILWRTVKVLPGSNLSLQCRGTIKGQGSSHSSCDLFTPWLGTDLSAQLGRRDNISHRSADQMKECRTWKSLQNRQKSSFSSPQVNHLSMALIHHDRPVVHWHFRSLINGWQLYGRHNISISNKGILIIILYIVYF